MGNCLNCGDKIIQTPGKREKQYCGSTCRSNFFQKKKRLEKIGMSSPSPVALNIGKENSKKKSKGISLPKDYVEVKNISTVSKNGEKTAFLFNKKEVEKRLTDLENEITSPPKSYALGLKFWHKMKQKELESLKAQLK